MAEKKKVTDYALSEQDFANIRQSRSDSINRIAKFNEEFKPTGSAFKDTTAMSPTSRDIKNVRFADDLLSKAATLATQQSATDMQYDLGKQQVQADLTKANIQDKVGMAQVGAEQAKTNMLAKAQADELGVKQGMLDLESKQFDLMKDSYNTSIAPSNKLSLATKAANMYDTFADVGLEPGTALDEFTPSLVRKKKP